MKSYKFGVDGNFRHGRIENGYKCELDDLVKYAAKADVYLAGPLFTVEERFKNQTLANELRGRFNLKVFNPQELNYDFMKEGKADELNHNITFPVDMAAIRNCEIAIIDVSNNDTGTLVELGYLAAQTEIRNLKLFVINSNPYPDAFGNHNFYVRGMCENYTKIIDFTDPNFKTNGDGLHNFMEDILNEVENHLDSLTNEIE